jgi:hypothetical protein
MSLTLVTGSADTNLCEKWDTRLKSCQQARLNFERQWYENLSFYFGRQWIVSSKNPSGSGFSLMEQPAQDKWRVRHTVNRILRIIRTEITKLSKEEPQFFCMPASTEESDRLAAMAGDAIADFIIRTKYFNRKRLEATFWACICGTSFIKNWYDPQAIEIDGQPGKIDFAAVPAPYLFVPDLQATEIELEPYVIHARTMSTDAVYTNYGVEIQPGTDASGLLMDARFRSAIGIKSDKQNDKMCYVKEVYCKPCKDYPNGCMIVYSEGKVLYVFESLPEQQFTNPELGPASLFDDDVMPNSISGPVGGNDSSVLPVGEVLPPKSDEPGLEGYKHEYPYRHARFPFAKIDHVPTGMFYGDSVIKYLVPVQREYNRTRSIMLENRNLAGKPQWAYTAGAFDPKKFNSRPGLLLAVNMGFDPPRPLEQPELPGSVSNDLQITLQDMDDIASQSEVSKGTVPPGVEAASAIAYLSEENDSIFHPTVQSLENAVQETGIQVLANVYDYWDETRIVRMTSRNQFMEVRQFKAQDLNPIMDFRVEAGSMAPRSLAAKQAFITELMKMGAIDPTKALRYLQMSETNKLYDEMMLDSRHAQRENVFMSQGQPLYKIDISGQAQPQVDPMTGMPQPAYKQAMMLDPQTGEPVIDPTTGQPKMYEITVNPFDAHDVHIEEHQNFQKTQEFELLPPEVQQIIQDHVDEHKMEMLKERNAIQADAAAKGEVPGEETVPPREIGPPGEEVPSPNGNGQLANVTG